MKKWTVILLISFYMPMVSLACDICGSGAGNNYIGILPEFQKQVIGLRYRSNSMLTHLGTAGNNTYLTTNEKYNIAEVWAGWNITPKLRIMISVPYNFNQKTRQGNTHKKNGIGDISLAAFYQLINKDNNAGKGKLLTHNLWLGGGVKLATGNYNPADKSNNAGSTNLFQLGSGSFDFNINGIYDARFQDAGININSNYKINTANKYDYQYGNKFNINTQVYYKISTKKQIIIAPNAGVQYEHSSTDRDENTTVFVSGGNLVSGILGVETVMGKFTIGVNYQKPVSQSLANGIAKAGNRLMLHVAFVL